MHRQPDDTAYTWEIAEHPGDKTAILRQYLGALNVERAQIDQGSERKPLQWTSPDLRIYKQNFWRG
jgi:hypothetical protein